MAETSTVPDEHVVAAPHVEVAQSDVAQVVQEVVRCKWMLHVLASIRAGIHRPGELSRSADGLTTKVLNERLEKLLRFGLISRMSYPEVPPRVEYTLTDRGRRFERVLDEIEELTASWNESSPD